MKMELLKIAQIFIRKINKDKNQTKQFTNESIPSILVE